MTFFETHIDGELRPLGEGSLSARRFRRVVRHARSCHRCASLYERAIRALRQLENRDPFVPAQVELDVITTLNAPRVMPRPARRRWWAFGAVALAAAAAALLVVRPLEGNDQFMARGGAAAGASLRVFCGGNGSPRVELKGEASCRVGQSLAFAVGASGANPSMVLELSGAASATSEVVEVTALPGAEAPVAFTVKLEREGPVELVAAFASDAARAVSAARGEHVSGAVLVRKTVKVAP